MIIPDTNLLLYAYNQESEFHDTARSWWESLLNGNERVGMPWLVTVGFVRILTNTSIMGRIVDVETALSLVDEWFSYAQVTPLNPGADHVMLFQQLLRSAGSGGNLVNDAHLAALAMENDAELHSNDADFRRFPGLRWQNPLQ